MPMRTGHSLAATTISLLAAVSLALSGCQTRTMGASRAAVPAAVVQQGDVQLKVVTRGLLNATHIFPLTAPPVAGAMLQIVHLVRTGAVVRKGDPVLEFDPSQQEYNLAQSRNDLAQAEEEIVKAKADAEVQAAEDQTALLKAKYAVRRAELDVSKNEIVSEIDAKKNLLTLNEARRALAQLQQDIQSHASSSQAGLIVSQEKQNKARLAMQQALQNIKNMKMTAPAAGIIVVHGNPSANGGMSFGMSMPDYQPGDQVGAGNTIADVIDISEMEINARVNEADRPSLKAGQPAEVQIDALLGKTFSGKILSVTGAANQEFWFGGSQRKFGVTVKLDHPDPRLRPGFTAKITLLGDRLAGVLSVPREAVFDRAEKSVVYVSRGGLWVQQDVKIRAVSEGRAILEGIAPGTTVALSDPESNSASKQTKSSAGPAAPGAP
jgi:HlyD family secretion protein